MTLQEYEKFLARKRESEIFLFIASKGGGKTTEIIRLNKGKRIFVVSYSPKDRGLAKYRTVNAEDINCKNIKPGAIVVVNTRRRDKTIYDTLYDMGERVFDSAIILDDSKSAVGSNPGLAFQQAIGACRHNCNDIFLSYWNINHPPPFVYDMVDNVALFKTAYVDIDRALSKAPRRDEIERAYAWVQSQDAPNYSYAYLFMNPLHPMSTRPFIKVLPQNRK